MTERTRRMAARYLGAKTPSQALELEKPLECAETALLPAVHFQKLVKRFPVTVKDGLFQLGAIAPIESANLSRLFHNAAEGLALAATLGVEADVLIKRLLITDPALGAAVGAYASAYVEELLDGLMREEQERCAADRLTLSPRFSPGYGDVPLSYQRPLTEAMECWRIGIRLTESFLMLPEKSVTALCAVRGAGECPEHLRGERACDRCPMTNCPYREEME